MDERNNVVLKRNIKLNPGEEFCPKCNGKGKTLMKKDVTLTCSKCYGFGKLDWIENAMGKKLPSGEQIEQWAIETMSQQIADEIDKEIIESVIKEAEEYGR